MRYPERGRSGDRGAALDGGRNVHGIDGQSVAATEGSMVAKLAGAQSPPRSSTRRHPHRLRVRPIC
ncbi:hypothetical protein C2I33_18905 [Ralstonia solanacearum]|nr:hypothetical protein C2I33_18905 [Ralstonia solanacearum]